MPKLDLPDTIGFQRIFFFRIWPKAKKCSILMCWEVDIQPYNQYKINFLDSGNSTCKLYTLHPTFTRCFFPNLGNTFSYEIKDKYDVVNPQGSPNFLRLVKLYIYLFESYHIKSIWLRNPIQICFIALRPIISRRKIYNNFESILH